MTTRRRLTGLSRSIEDRIAIVTGAASGMGRATAHLFADEGARVVVADLDRERVDAVVDEITAVHGDGVASGIVCDVADHAQLRSLVDRTVAWAGRIDIVVNNAGGQFPSPAQHISPNGFLAVVKNNLVGTFHVCREVANQHMIAAKRGRIVNVIANIYRGFPGMAHTGAARAGVENLTMSLAVEWAQFGILVNAIAPGVILSSGTAQYPAEILQRAITQTPVKRAGTVDEVAAAIIFLAGPAAQFITGTTLRMDGGQALWGNTWEIP